MTRTIMILAGPVLGAALTGAPSAAQQAMPPHQTFTVESAALGETRRINVYTPPNYAGLTKYPVLYLLDGGVEEDWPHVTSTIDAAIRAGEMRRMIVVGIENTERRRDMTGPTEVEEDRSIAPRVGGSASFRRFIETELMPQVGRRYQVTSETAVMGESLAGLFVVETLLLQPELFATYVALDPSLWWNGGELVRTADARVRARSEWSRYREPTVVFLASADEESIAPATARLAEVLRANTSPRLRPLYQPRPDLTHATLYRAMAPGVLRELFPPAQHVVSITGTGPDGGVPADAGPVSPLEPGTDLAAREPAGAFVILREEYRNPSAGIHMPSRWTRIHLSWDAPDGRVNVALGDDGAGLVVRASALGCHVFVNYLQYGYDGGERHLFGAMRTALRTLVDGCSRGMDDPGRYERLLTDAEADFDTAMQRMKAHVAERFGPRTERCNPPDPNAFMPPSTCG
jgi:predicted alpha/beta superfamily hydrolase